jgi:hypothetical protein
LLTGGRKGRSFFAKTKADDRKAACLLLYEGAL